MQVRNYTMGVAAGLGLLLVMGSCKARKTAAVVPVVDTVDITEAPLPVPTAPAVAIAKDTTSQLISNELMSAARTIDPEVNSAMLVSGKAIYTGACVKCHAFKDAKKFTPERWEKILVAMSPKARLTADQARDLRVYTLAYQKS